MIRLSITFRQALNRLTLPVMIAASFAVMLLGKADVILAEKARMALADTLAPIYGAIAEPMANLRQVIGDVQGLATIRSDNARLRDENERLRRWQAAALALDAENTSLKANLHWIPDPAPSYVTAPVVADAGGVYARSVLLSTGPNHPIVKGEIALDERGLVGRITDVGNRSARVLLITDMNSRIPVTLENSRARALLTGNNTARPRLMFWPEGVMPQEGERVVTSAQASAFPAGLPVGTVHYSAGNVPEVEPAALLDRLEVVRIFDYGLGGVTAPETPAAAPVPATQGPATPVSMPRAMDRRH